LHVYIYILYINCIHENLTMCTYIYNFVVDKKPLLDWSVKDTINIFEEKHNVDTRPHKANVSGGTHM